MNKPRIFLGSSGKQAKLLQAITRGLGDVADVEPWTTTFNPGRSTLDRLVELSREVDFAAFVFAQDDWTTTDASQSGEASPRDNVVFEAGLFGGALGIRRTFILHAHGSKLRSLRHLPGMPDHSVTRRSEPRGGAGPRPRRRRRSPRAGRGPAVAGRGPAAGRRRAARRTPGVAGPGDRLEQPVGVGQVDDVGPAQGGPGSAVVWW